MFYCMRSLLLCWDVDAFRVSTLSDRLPLYIYLFIYVCFAVLRYCYHVYVCVLLAIAEGYVVRRWVRPHLCVLSHSRPDFPANVCFATPANAFLLFHRLA